MNDNQFTAIFETLMQIEQNTRKKDYSVSNISPSTVYPFFEVDEIIKQVQELFFSKLQLQINWTQNGIKQLFTESIRTIRGPASISSIEEGPV